MPISNDNQDFGQSDKKNKKENAPLPTGNNTLTTDDLKGKKIDADVENEKDRPADQQNNG
ncbi:MAG: hypothetical protein M3040_04960 [Bacteroidota bacterium]|nr:hypothetical protein [Bacteroidota bacterium]